jgi:XTP/dITP diphosphohydrolase
MSTNTDLPKKDIVLASGNKGKLAEFQQMLGGLGLNIIPLSEFTDISPEETGLSFVENAIIKARFASQHSGLPALADDSGLEVDALRGQPGIYSARFAGPNADDNANNIKLLNSLEGLAHDERDARFRCVLAFMQHSEDPSPIISTGTWEGRILQSLSGIKGFGYDPLFFAPETQCSAAELSKTDKNSLSHRGKALRVIMPLLQKSLA